MGDVLPVVPRTNLTSGKEVGGMEVQLGNVGPTLRSVSGGGEWCLTLGP